MIKKQQGFTLIELVAVIVILGALAVVALPRFINLQDEAREAALEGVAGSASAAHAVNLAGALAGDDEARNVTDCDQTGNLMQGGTPNGYQFASLTMSTGQGAPTDCTLEQLDDDGTTVIDSQTFTGYYVSGQ